MSIRDDAIQLPPSASATGSDLRPLTASSLRVPHEITGVRRARRTVAEHLAAAGVPDQARDDVLLVLSELVSNAVRHAEPLPTGEIGVSWSVTPDVIHLEITDGGASTRPQASVVAMTSMGGRGLDIVRSVSSRWGVIEREGSVTVWADLPVPAEH